MASPQPTCSTEEDQGSKNRIYYWYRDYVDVTSYRGPDGNKSVFIHINKTNRKGERKSVSLSLHALQALVKNFPYIKEKADAMTSINDDQEVEQITEAAKPPTLKRQVAMNSTPKQAKRPYILGTSNRQQPLRPKTPLPTKAPPRATDVTQGEEFWTEVEDPYSNTNYYKPHYEEEDFYAVFDEK